MERLPPFFVVCRLTVQSTSGDFGQEDRHPKRKCLSVREVPTPFRQGHPHFSSARIPPPRVSNQPVAFIDTSGRLQEGRKQAQNSLILFREFPPPFSEQEHTPSGLRADIQGRHKSYPMPPRADASQNPRRLRKWWAV